MADDILTQEDLNAVVPAQQVDLNTGLSWDPEAYRTPAINLASMPSPPMVEPEPANYASQMVGPSEPPPAPAPAPQPPAGVGNLAPMPQQAPQAPPGQPGVPGVPSVQPYLQSIKDANAARGSLIEKQQQLMGKATNLPMPTTREDALRELDTLNQATQGRPPTETEDLRRLELAEFVSQGEQEQRTDLENSAREIYRLKEETIADQKRAMLDEFKRTREEGMAKKKAWEDKLANADVGMTGTDWAAFIGLSILGVLGAAATGATNPGGGLFQAFVNKWADGQVRKREQQIELYRMGLTNARNDLMDMRDDFRDDMQAKEVLLGGLKSKLANDLARVAEQYPGTLKQIVDKQNAINQLKRNHDVRWDELNMKQSEGNMNAQGDMYKGRLQDLNAKLSVLSAMQQRGPNPEAAKALADQRRSTAGLRALEATKGEASRESVAKKLGIDIPKGFDLSDDAAWSKLIGDHERSLNAQFNALTGGGGLYQPAQARPTVDQVSGRK